MNLERSKMLQAKSHTIIPGGAHTYAKGDDQYPEMAPAFLVKGKGCHVWDADGNEYIEYGMGLRAVTLGHAYEPVIQAAYQQMLLGENFNRPSPIEIECAEKVLSLIHGAEMAKFGKNGSDVTTAAVKLARAYTGRDLVGVCADHPFFSSDDWFIGSSAMAGGIPQVIRDLTVKFRYNDLDSVTELFATYPGQIACLIMEAQKTDEPADGFLQKVIDLCHRHGAVFILDEIITGFRLDLHGAQHLYHIEPDLSAFGKGMGNGFSVAVLVGKKALMELGGLHHDKERVFLLSQTYGAENHILAAALATMTIYEKEPVVETLYRQGERLTRSLQRAISEYHLHDYFKVLGRPANLIYATLDQDKKPSQPFRTLFLQETIKRGLIMPSMVVSYSHTDADIDRTIEAVAEALSVYRRALEDGIEKFLVGRPVKPVFRKFNNDSKS